MEGSQGASGPSEGWYDDPHDSGRLRWWDGSAWSEHTHEKAPSQPEPESEPEVTTQQWAAAQSGGTSLPAQDFSLPAGPGASDGRKPYAALPWVAAAAALILAIGFFALAFGGGGDEGGASTDSVSDAAADSDAKAAARTGQTAIETYATDNNGSYANATPQQLVTIEPLLAGVPLAAEGQEEGYSLSVSSASGTVFTIARSPGGMTLYTCSAPGTGGCPEGGDWAGE
jgi:hypothetical protein